MLDMGFAEDIEAILSADARGPADRAVLRDHAAAHRGPGPPAPQRPGADPDRAASPSRRARRRRCARRAYLVPRAHKPAALGRVLDIEAPTAAIVFCRTRDEVDTAHRDAERPRLPGRGAARRDEPGPARPGDGPPARRDGGPAGGHRRRRPRAGHRAPHPRRQLRRAVRRRSPTCTASGASAGPGARAWRSRSPSPASTGCSRRSSGSPVSGSPMEQVPTVADLRARRLELTRAALRESLLDRRPGPLPRRRRDASPTSSTSCRWPWPR